MPPDLVDAVLARTSGRTCGSARERLCGFVDETLESVDSQLVAAHVGNCDDCAALAGALERLTRELPTLAEMALDPTLVPEVLARTTGRRRGLARVLEGWLRRPRFALEAAYVGTFVLAILFGLPASPLAGVPRKALDLVSVNPVAEIEKPLADLGKQARTAWLATSGKVADGGAELLSTTKERVGTFWERLASNQETDDAQDTTDEGESK